jgi:hypothetical protein
LFGLIPAVIAIYLGATEWQAFTIYWVVGSLAIIPVDKKIDGSWRGTAKISAEKTEDA